MSQEIPDVQAEFRKGEGARDQIASICWIIEKARKFQKKIYFGFPCGSAGKEAAWQCGGPGLGRFPGEGNGNPLRYSCLGNPMDRGALWAIVHRAAKESDTTYWLNNNCLHNIVYQPYFN